MEELFQSGKMFTGCNYWASHAGTEMWRNWNAEAVEADFARLEKSKNRVVRLFPLWRDFQPIRMHHGGSNEEKEMRIGDEPLPHTEEGKHGIDPVMVERFQWVCDCAKRHGLKLVVAIVTGWMSGRLFAPEALHSKDMLNDPQVNRWQVRFVRYMVRRFKNEEVIVAWSLGNECNCMAPIDVHKAYCWTALIGNTIRAEDPTRPVLSGMHGLLPNGAWTPADQGELMDILCTHPYPIFTPHCHTDPINEMKSVLHSTAQSIMYAGLGGKPCYIEEAGTLGPMIANERIAGDYVRACLFSAWAHDLRGYLWWCANEQSHLETTPYDWCAVERELGMFHLDHSPKPVCEEMTAFANFTESLPIEKLPPRVQDAVCVLTEGQDTWGVAYGTFILAKQAGLDISFCWHTDEIPEAKAYLLPSLTGDLNIRRRVMWQLMQKVEAGATLYMSLNTALLSPFKEVTGLEVIRRSQRAELDDLVIDGEKITGLGSNFRCEFAPVGAEVLLATEDGNPAFTKFAYGKGTVYFCSLPIELEAATKPGRAANTPMHKIYQQMGIRSKDKVATSDRFDLCITEHIFDENTRYLCLLNYAPRQQSANITLDGWHLAETYAYRGGSTEATTNGFAVTLPANTGLLVKICR